MNEQKQRIKDELNNNRRLKRYFMKLVNIVLQKDIFYQISIEAFDVFKIEYDVEKVFYDEWTWKLRKTYIWYFNTKISSQDDFNSRIETMRNFIYSVMEWIVKKTSAEQNVNYVSNLNWLLAQKPLSHWLSHFSTILTDEIARFINQFQLTINSLYKENFYKVWDKLFINPGTDYLNNEEKNKLFREYKLSYAENLYIDNINSCLKVETKEKIKNWYNDMFEWYITRLVDKLAEISN